MLVFDKFYRFKMLNLCKNFFYENHIFIGTKQSKIEAHLKMNAQLLNLKI